MICHRDRHSGAAKVIVYAPVDCYAENREKAIPYSHLRSSSPS